MILLTQQSGFLKPIAWVLGKIFNGLFELVYVIDKAWSGVNLPIIGICVILFTIIVKLLMLPLTIKSQRFSKLSSMMNPELQAIQKKYKDKKDTDSMMKMNAETKAVYAKYGASPSAGCLPLLIQLPIMFALYRVIYKIPGYVTKISSLCTDIRNDIMGVDGGREIVQGIGKAYKSLDLKGTTTSDINSFIDKAYTLSSTQWNKIVNTLSDKGFTDAAASIKAASTKLINMTNFCGINLNDAPGFKWSLALIIPVLAGVTQFISAQLTMSKNKVKDGKADDDAMAGSMKAMNYVMPLISVFFCISLPSCIGIYWITSSVVQIVIQIIVNAQIDKMDPEQMMQANIDKVNAKRAKKGLPPQKIANTASTYVEEVKRQEARDARKAERDKEMADSTDYYKSAGKPGSLAAKANMVKMYNERNEKNKTDNKNKNNK